MSLTKSKSKSRKNRQNKRKTKINKKNNLRGGSSSLLTNNQVRLRDYGESGYGQLQKKFNYKAANAQRASNLRASSTPNPVNPNVPVKGFGLKPNPSGPYVPKKFF